MINFLINFAAVLGAVKILSDLVAASHLGEGLQQRLRSFFERWQATLENPSPNTILAVPFSALSRTYDRAFGSQPFSLQTFRRTCIFGSVFIGAALGFAGFFCGKPFAMNILPWDSFAASIQYLHILAKEPAIHQIGGDPFYIAKNASDLAKLNSWPFAVLFTIYFVIVVVVANASLFSLSISISRLFLREMLSARSSFAIFVLFLSNTILLLIFGATATIILFVLLNVWSWPFVPLLFGLSNISFLAGAGVASGASLCSWFFSGTWLKVVVVVSLFPSIMIAVLIGVALLGFAFRSGFHPLAAIVIRFSLRSPKGMIPFFNAVIATFAMLCACVASIWGWLERVNFSQGFSTLFGFDLLILSSLVLFGMLFLSSVRAKYYKCHFGSSLRFIDILFLFTIAVIVIGAGFYIEEILECLFPAILPLPKGIISNMALPAVDSLLPGSIIGYLYVLSQLARKSFFNLALQIFGVLSAWDLLMAIVGSCPIRDSAISIVCDLFGSLFAAFILSRAYLFFFRV